MLQILCSSVRVNISKVRPFGMSGRVGHVEPLDFSLFQSLDIASI